MTDFLVNRKTDRYHLVIASIEKICPEDISKRQKEAKASREIVAALHPNQKLSHDEFGAPTLSNGKAISISHSNDFIAILISEKSASVDLEIISEKALKTAPKFLNEKELEFTKNDEKATLMWSAKECLYKIYKKGGLTFSKDLSIQSLNESKIECLIFDEEFTLTYEKFKNYWLVYYFD